MALRQLRLKWANQRVWFLLASSLWPGGCIAVSDMLTLSSGSGGPSPRMPKALPFRRVHACYSFSLAPAFSFPFKRMILGIAAHARKSTVETARFSRATDTARSGNAVVLCRSLFLRMKSRRCI